MRCTNRTEAPQPTLSELLPSLPRDVPRRRSLWKCYLRFCISSQICFFKAATGNAFTTFLAGFAATFVSLPKMFLTPAFVAGFVLVLILHSPGTVNTPVFLTSAQAISTKEARKSEQAFCFKPCSSASILVTAPLVMGLVAAAFMDVDFIGAMISE